MRYSFFPLLVLTLALTACKIPPSSDNQQQAVRPQPKEVAQQPRGSIVGNYKMYQEGVIGNGEKSVLFFHAAWCPMCKEKDENLRKWYGTEDLPMKTYQVDFDTSLELKKKYGITMQDTFVLIDGNGETIKVESAPTLSQLKRLLYGNMEKAKAKEPTAMNDAEELSAPTPTLVASETSYTQYTPGVIGNGKESVLFFHAAWCPFCKENNDRLSAWYGSDDFPRSVYKIDFDTSLDLRSQFGVIGQDTFILIDGNGNEIQRERFPSESALRDLLG